MRKFLTLMLSLAMVMTVIPTFAFAGTKDAALDYALNVEDGNLTFEASGWEVDESGEYAVSTNHADDSESMLTTNVTVKAGDVLTYEYMVSSEFGYDGLLIYINGEAVDGYTGESYYWDIGYWIFEEAGNYTIGFGYYKDVSDSDGDDCAYIDNVYVGENIYELEDIEVADSMTLAVNSTKLIDVIPVPAYAPLGEVTFASDDEEVVTVDKSGRVTGVAVGETYVTVTAGDYEAYIYVEVVEGANANAFVLYDDSETYEEGYYAVELITGEHNFISALDDMSVFAAEALEGTVFGYTSTGDFFEMDATTGEYTIIKAGNGDTTVVGMSFDYTSNTMYGIIANPADDGETSVLVEIDIATGEYTPVATFDHYAIAFAINADGLIVTAAYDTGVVTAYSLENGTLTEEDSMYSDYSPAFIQTMAFDRKADKLYWLGMTSDSGFIALVDFSEGLNVLSEEAIEYAGAFFPYDGHFQSVAVTGITLDVTEATLEWGKTVQLTATVTPDDAFNKRVEWTTSNADVATVVNGLVRATGAGTATITATTKDGGFTATCEVTVTGNAQTLLYEDFEDALEGWQTVDSDSDGYTWTPMVNQEGILTHNGNGVIVSQSFINGLGALTPDNWLISPSFTVTGKTYLSWFVTGQDPDYCEENYSVYVLPVNANVTDESTQVYTGLGTSEWTEVTVDLSSFAGQEVKIAFRHHDVTDMYWLNIDDILVVSIEDSTNVPVTGVTLDVTEATVRVGKTVQLTATVAPEDATNKNLVWETSDAAIATVDENGLVTAIAAGTATITVKTVDGEFTATCEITVIEFVIGDANGDGRINTGDAVMVLRYFAELQQLDGDDIIAADMNQDGKVNTGDAVAILKYITADDPVTPE